MTPGVHHGERTSASITYRRGMDRAVLTTGANSGLGLAIAVELAKRGYRSIGSVRTKAKANEVAREAKASGVEVETVLLDVKDADRCAEVIDDLELYGLVNNAGYSVTGAVEDTPDDEARDLLETMVVAPMRLARLALPGMRGRGEGRIVNISSIYGRFTTPFTGWYQAAKHGLEGVTDALRMEVAGMGVKVVLVEPGGFRTAIFDEVSGDLDRRGADTPYRRGYDRMLQTLKLSQPFLGDPQVVARVVAGAMSSRVPRARYLVGNDAQAAALTERFTPTFVKDLVTRRGDGPGKGGADSASPQIGRVVGLARRVELGVVERGERLDTATPSPREPVPGLAVDQELHPLHLVEPGRGVHDLGHRLDLVLARGLEEGVVQVDDEGAVALHVAVEQRRLGRDGGLQPAVLLVGGEALEELGQHRRWRWGPRRGRPPAGGRRPGGPARQEVHLRAAGAAGLRRRFGSASSEACVSVVGMARGPSSWGRHSPRAASPTTARTHERASQASWCRRELDDEAGARRAVGPVLDPHPPAVEADVLVDEGEAEAGALAHAAPAGAAAAGEAVEDELALLGAARPGRGPRPRSRRARRRLALARRLAGSTRRRPSTVAAAVDAARCRRGWRSRGPGGACRPG